MRASSLKIKLEKIVTMFPDHDVEIMVEGGGMVTFRITGSTTGLPDTGLTFSQIREIMEVLEKEFPKWEHELYASKVNGFCSLDFTTYPSEEHFTMEYIENLDKLEGFKIEKANKRRIESRSEREDFHAD